jgi:hypothetical protein
MFVRSKSTADKRVRNGMTSFFMFGRGDAGEEQIAITLVDVPTMIMSGSMQKYYAYAPDQVSNLRSSCSCSL